MTTALPFFLLFFTAVLSQENGTSSGTVDSIGEDDTIDPLGEVNITTLTIPLSEENETLTTLLPPVDTTSKDLPTNMSTSEVNNTATTTLAALNTTLGEGNTPTETTTTTTTTITTTTTESPVRENTKFKYSAHCTCDLTGSSCDVNCCCDPDCGSEERLAFSRCVDQTPRSTLERYCYNPELVFTNNTVYTVEQVSDSLFCIITDNIPERNRYVERVSTDNLTVFNALDSRHRRFQWTLERKQEPFTRFNRKTSYKAGSNILVQYKENVFGDLVIPSLNPISGKCDSLDPVKYMENHVTSCLVHLEEIGCEETGILNGNNFVKDFEIVPNPEMFNPQYNQTDIEPVYLTVSAYLCEDDPTCENCEGTGCTNFVPAVSFPSPTKECNNVVMRVHYDIFHDGINGIDSIDAFVTLTDNGVRHLKQTFSYSSHWTNENKTDNLVKSGNPGYIDGKPVLSGVLVNNGDTPYINMDAPQESISYFRPGTSGLCNFDDKVPRVAVKFGEDVQVGCSVYRNRTEVTSLCDQLKKSSFQLLFGLDFGQLKERYVATFGDSQPNNTGDWVKTLLVNVPDYGGKEKKFEGRCNDLVLTLNVEILYAHIGSLANPQKKIVGVAYKFGTPRDLIFRCVGLACNHRSKTQRIDFSLSVTFQSVSQPAIAQYAAYPVLEAKFPHDFFYPFVSSSAENGGGTYIQQLCIICLLAFNLQNFKIS